MLKNIIAWALLTAGLATSLAAQSNDRLDELLSQAQARLDSTSYLLLASSGVVAEDATPDAAFAAAQSAGWIGKDRQPGDGVSVEDLSFLVMKSQKLSGGIEWMFLPSPRAAYREMDAKGLINSSAGPKRLVAGDEVIRTFSAAHPSQGGQE
ncbi:MAG TPA: hypothetical protein VMB23_08105 [Spirochaetia bacterium]|nr:hypothetical protein [Spirochaetia bacterium]